jgi:sugar lactone lactonase YvrE
MAMQYRQLRTISGKGAGPAQFRDALRGIALDTQGHLYAAGDSEVKVFDADGTLVRRWPTALPPFSIAVAAGGGVWVGQAGQIEVFDAAGKLRRTWKDAARLVRVTSLGFLKDGVLAGDSAQRCIHRFDLAGNYINTIGKENPLGGLAIPNGVVDFGIDQEGVIHVPNPGKHRVERYSPEGKLLGHMGKFTGPDPSGFSGCCNPTNVAVAGKNLLCVTEKAGPRAKTYDYAGVLVAVIDSADFDPMTRNMDVAVDARGTVYVADPVKAAVFVFASEGGARL